jgi:ribosome-binding protein aMBF1 (putative translation factor)
MLKPIQGVFLSNSINCCIDGLTRNDPELEDLVREASLNAVVAQLIYEARTTRGMTQKQLADRIGTKQSAIARLEDADYSNLRTTAPRDKLSNSIKK